MAKKGENGQETTSSDGVGSSSGTHLVFDWGKIKRLHSHVFHPVLSPATGQHLARSRLPSMQHLSLSTVHTLERIVDEEKKT